MDDRTPFDDALAAWCQEEGLVWEFDTDHAMHVFTEQPLDPVEHSLEVCFGDYEPVSARVSMYVMKAVQSLEVPDGVYTITQTITHTLDRARRIRNSEFSF